MEKPFRTTLPNGLRILLLESHAAPVVSINLWANVGSVNENDQEAGLCHLIEHMLFKGTGRRAVGQIAKEVEAAGGDMNAYTSFDETVFYINMSSRRYDIGLDILADAASDPTFDATELTREKEVVVEEISRAEDSPSQMVSQDLFSTAFTVHPYQHPIAGSRETVRGVSREYLLEFYRRWYVASNLILIVTGDFKKEEILPKIEALYSKIPSGKAPVQDIPTEPAQKDPRLITRGMPVEGRYLDVAFPIPHMTHKDIPALDILAHVLGGGPSSRLEHILKEKKQLVSGIHAYPYTPRYPCLFIVGSVLRQKALAETLKTLWEEIEKLKTEPPTAVEFTRARANILSSRIYERQTVEGLARKLGYYEGIANDLGFEEEYYQKLALVTPDDVQSMAQKYLLPERITLSLCHPNSETWSQETIRKMLPLPKSDLQKPRAVKKTSPEEITSFKLPSGIRLLVRRNPTLPLISIRSASLGGTRGETRRNNGINQLIASLLTKGTYHRTTREIAEESENLSGSIDGYAGRDLIGVQGVFLAEKITEGLNLFFDLLLNPSFPEEEIRKEKGHFYTAIRNEQDSLATVATRKFLEVLYPSHPYGLPPLGTTDSLRSLKRKDLIRHYQASIRSSNLVLSVVGDVDPHEIRNRIAEKLKSWRFSKGRNPAPSAPKPPKTPIVVTTKKKRFQAHIIYGFLGTTIRSTDQCALEVLSSILSGQGGRLFIELRDKQGLAYAISFSSHEGIEPGYIAVYMGTDPKKVDTALAGIREELGKIRKDLVSSEELERSKKFIIGNYELDLQKNSSVASILAYNEIHGIRKDNLFTYPEKIATVTREDVLRVAKKYLRPEASVLSVIQP